MVVYGNRQDFLGPFLSDDVFVEKFENLGWFGNFVETYFCVVCEFFFDDFVAEIDALIADVHPGSSNKLFDLFLRFSAEGAFK